MISASPVAAIPCFLNSAEAASTILWRVFAVSCLDILITQLFLKTLGPTSSQRPAHLSRRPQGYCTSISCPVAAKEGSLNWSTLFQTTARKLFAFHLTIQILHVLFRCQMTSK